ncbi:MAG TPA: 5-deoxy-glucuronate isomerase [Vicinamibacterales bacterium]|nr:5-deoxy-glucuronate isomerase [Vicinamibacterales bacterium]
MKLKLTPRNIPARESGVTVGVTPRQARWRFVRFAVHQLAIRSRWRSAAKGEEICLVLLEGFCHVECDGQTHTLGPRGDVFSGYPHAIYLPPGTAFTVIAGARTLIAECAAPTKKRFPLRVITPEDCGFEIRGGGNATRQIVDIMPPAFAAHRLLICEVYTPGGNWSSYPPHKHDRDAPPAEVDLEETYYYRFRERDAFGVQRLYGPRDRPDETLTVRNGDLVLVRDGYHPFVAAHGYDAYYLNVLGGTRRSMAASDDPRYAQFRARWPAPDPRVPVVPPPYPVAPAGTPATTTAAVAE